MNMSRDAEAPKVKNTFNYALNKKEIKRGHCNKNAAIRRNKDQYLSIKNRNQIPEDLLPSCVPLNELQAAAWNQ